MNDPVNFQYIHLASGVLTVLVGVWFIIRGERSKQARASAAEDILPVGQSTVYLGGMFGQITSRLEHIAVAIKELHERTDEIHARDQARLDESHRLHVEVINELRGIREILTEAVRAGAGYRRR